MKLSEIKGENAIDLLADIIEPASLIMSDDEVSKIYKSKQPIIKLVQYILKAHKKEVLEIVSVLEGVKPEEVNVLTLPKTLMEIMNDELLIQLFPSASKS